jgi:hypothetical protein
VDRREMVMREASKGVGNKSHLMLKSSSQAPMTKPSIPFLVI